VCFQIKVFDYLWYFGFLEELIVVPFFCVIMMMKGDFLEVS